MASEPGDITASEPEHCTFLTVLDEIGLADCQQVMDALYGGYAAIATSRAN